MVHLDDAEISRLAEIATRVRGHVLRCAHHAQGAHVGGSLSAAEILVYLYFKALKIDPRNPEWEDRDRFVLSKGHAAVALYSVLAERGYFPLEELETFDEIDSRLQAHPDANKTPGIDMSSGSLGQGLSAGLGMALGARLLGKDFHTYVMIGDGESQEGQTWEAAWVAARYCADNLTAILDNNRLQYCQWPDRVCGAALDNPAAKFRAFGWHTLEMDGHDFRAIGQALEEAAAVQGRPAVIIANTTKGKGVSFIEDSCAWHVGAPSDEQLSLALEELGLPRER